MTRSFLIGVTLAAMGALCTPVAIAQTQDAPAVGQQQAAAYSDAELKSFAVAALNVQRIKNLYRPKLQAAGTPEEEEQIREAATREMMQAVEDEGMTVNQYTEIATQMMQSPEIAKRIEEHAKDALTK